MEMMAESHRSIAETLKEQAMRDNIKDQMSALQMEYTMHQGMGDLDAARLCISKLQQL
jgi:hypothetical protein